MVKEITSSPIFVHVVRAGKRMRSPTISGLLHNFFHGEFGDDAAQWPFHHQADQALALVWSFGQELLCGGQNGFPGLTSL